MRYINQWRAQGTAWLRSSLATIGARRRRALASLWQAGGRGTGWLAALVALFVLVLALNSALAYRSVLALAERETTVTHSEHVQSALEAILNTLDDAETGQRGYILTGNAAYLQPYLNARQQIAPELAQVTILLANESGQLKRLATLKPLITEKFSELQQTVTLAQQGQNSQALALVLSNHGKELMDAIRSQISGLEHAEARLLKLQDQAVQRSLTATGFSLALATLIDVGLLISIVFLARHTLREREEHLAHERAARLQAEAGVRLRDQFLSLASHELNTPLTAAITNTQLLERHTAHAATLSERDQRLLGAVERQLTRLRLLITRMLDVSRIEQGQLGVAAEPMDLLPVIRQSIEELETTTMQHTFLLTGDAVERDGPVWIRGDAGRLEQVFQNLLQNAIKYSPEGGQITVTVAREDATATVAIRDEGIGIPADALSHLFTRFYRAANVGANHINGLGIGLYVVRDIVTQQGGTIEVTSAEGEGSTFTITLPLLPQPPIAALQPTASDPDQGGVDSPT